MRSVGDGREVAQSIHQYLGGRRPTGVEKPFSSRIKQLKDDEMAQYMALAGPGHAVTVRQTFALNDAVEQAGRCLHCDCRALTNCNLRRYAALYGADQSRFKNDRRAFTIHIQDSRILYESGKCIDCGLCVQIAERAREPLGLTFIGRGFNVRIGVPFNRTLEEALTRVAAECVAACPTAALSFRDTPRGLALPLVDVAHGQVSCGHGCHGPPGGSG